MDKIKFNIYFNKNELVKLNKRGQRKHKSYPIDKALKIIDIYTLPGIELERYTCSCDEAPNPRSKKGVYYVLNTEVEEYIMEEKTQIDLTSFEALNTIEDIEKYNIDNITTLVNKCLNTLEDENIGKSIDVLQKVHNHLNNTLKIKSISESFFDSTFANNVKYSLLYALDRKLVEKINAQEILIKYDKFYIEKIAHKIVTYLYSTWSDGLSVNELMEHFREDNFKISFKDFGDATSFLMSLKIIDHYFYSDCKEIYFKLIPSFKEYLKKRKL